MKHFYGFCGRRHCWSSEAAGVSGQPQRAGSPRQRFQPATAWHLLTRRRFDRTPMNMRTRMSIQRETRANPAELSYHAESLPNASASFSVSTMADREDILAAVRTAILLARTSRMSLSVTVLDESVLQAGPGDSIAHETLDNLLNSIRTKLFIPRPMHRSVGLALEASITSASFLTTGAITLQIRSVDSLPQNLSSSR